MTITHKAGALQPGDILPADDKRPRRVVLDTHMAGPTSVVLVLAPIGPAPRGVPSMGLPPETYSVEGSVEVDVPPAQYYADDLLDLARKLANDDPFRGAVRELARSLVDRIEPKPPTAEELARALDGIDPGHMPPSVRAVLERAQRTILKESKQ